MDIVRVEPLAEGWAVRAAGLANDMIFRSGRAAETAAKTLAFRLAEAGRTVELELRLRTGLVGARFVCVPPAGEGDEVLMLSLPGLVGAGLSAGATRRPVSRGAETSAGPASL
jgi:hypothetical protein